MESTPSTLVLSHEERQKRLEEFHKGYDENVLDENLRKEKSRVIATLSEYFNREMILADECLIKGDESGAAVYSHIAKVIDAALKELEESEE
ncbi:MAG TPA: hypothetical protein VD694_01850 [Nitrososphaeraceae archaeon]|nr:hypothetical protein [Nitrososphaeraceae archaeon]